MHYNFKINVDQKTKILPKTKRVNLYVCGPTVYNHIHIGNARPLIVFDILYRLLKYLDYDVNYVQNVTDIDDKIIAAAAQQQVVETEISQKFLGEYNKICRKLNAFNFSQQLVSKNITKIQNFIERLVQNQSAYLTDDAVYFNVKKIKRYGIHSNRFGQNHLVGEKNKTNIKINNQDFALWKLTQTGLAWPSKWGRGRPGWHTECVTLIEKNFGTNLTIHGGGIDLKFPHHENEIAQFYALYKKRLSQFWIYVGHVMMGDEKMSKSLGNFIYVKDLLEKYNPNVIRWWFLSTNPLLPIKYTHEAFDNCDNEWNKLVHALNRAKSAVYLNQISFHQNDHVANNAIKKLANSLDLANFVTEIQQIIKEINVGIKQNKIASLEKKVNLVQNTLDLVGFKLINLHTNQNIKLLRKWKTYVNQKRYTHADIVRQKLLTLKLL